ncbi:hypothetical protein [Myxococcus stipitatus]|uniref:hypothetical protein n=1 Tax=Myxococcus stipitatus TaxID=83455 RepID=UPI001184A100|nr:hypothetical protein [Myxococcus stipitatus]
MLVLNGETFNLGDYDAASAEMQRFLSACSSSADPTIAGKTVSQWERDWTNRRPLTDNFSDLRESVGVYRAWFEGSIVYIGRATEWSNGGFRKRLRDYTRQGDGNRQSPAGQLMYLNREVITINVLVTGRDRDAAFAAHHLETILIAKYNPPWNIHGIDAEGR